MEWVAIDVHIAGNAVTHRLAELFKLRVAEAAGLLALTFAGMAQHAADGSLADVTNSQIEEWARWHGKRGALATFLRANEHWLAAHLKRGGRKPASGLRSRQPRRKIPRTVRAFVFARDGGLCRGCHTPERLQLDHVVPCPEGGSDSAENLQLLCRPCNVAKGPRRRATRRRSA